MDLGLKGCLEMGWAVFPKEVCDSKVPHKGVQILLLVRHVRSFRGGGIA